MHKYFSDISRQMFLLILFLSGSMVMAAMVSYVLLPQYKVYLSSNASYQTLSSTMTNSGNYQDDMDEIQEHVSQLQKRLNGEAINLPFQQFESHVIGQLQQLAWKNKIELGGVRPNIGQMVDRYREVIFDVELAGGYFDLYQFLLDFEDVLGFVVINEFHISPQVPTSAAPVLQVEMSIASYRAEQL